MWKSEKQTVNSKQQTAGKTFLRFAKSDRVRRFVSCLVLFAVCCLLFASCRRDMQDQPKMKPYRSTVFFKDGLSSRPLVEGTVPRGFLKTDTEFFTGKKAGRASSAANNAPPPTGPRPGGPGANNATNV